MSNVRVQSFGYLLSGRPTSKVWRVYDARTLPNPGAMGGKTGEDQEVIDFVMASPLSHSLLSRILADVESGRVAWLAIGCAYGRHRSVVLANAVAEELGIVAEHVDLGHRLHR